MNRISYLATLLASVLAFAWAQPPTNYSSTGALPDGPGVRSGSRGARSVGALSARCKHAAVPRISPERLTCVRNDLSQIVSGHDNTRPSLTRTVVLSVS